MPRIARITLMIFTLLLLAGGLTMLYSTSYDTHGEWFLKRQVVWIGIGGVFAVLASWKFGDAFLGRHCWWLLGLVALPLAYLAAANLLYHCEATRSLARQMPLVGGLTKGSARWLRLGPISIQPSEVAKLAIIVFLAYYLPRNVRHLKEFWRGFLKPLGAVGIVTGLILLGGDLSSTVITGGIVFCASFIGGIRLRYLLPVALGGLVLGAAAIHLSPERTSRVTSFRDPEAVQQGAGYQLWHSQLALGSGGWRGLRLTYGRIKRDYLPEAHTDFIVAIVGEELGYLGVATLMALYLGLTGTAFWLAALARDREGIIVCSCIGVTFGLQSFVNISVVSGFGPTTGVTAPFLSYGGSSMIVSLAMIGLLVGVSLRSELAAETWDASDERGGSDRQPPPRLGKSTQWRNKTARAAN